MPTSKKVHVWTGDHLKVPVAMGRDAQVSPLPALDNTPPANDTAQPKTQEAITLDKGFGLKPSVEW